MTKYEIQPLVCTEPRKGHRIVFLSIFLSRYHKIVSQSFPQDSKSFPQDSKSLPQDMKSFPQVLLSHALMPMYRQFLSL